VWNRLFNLHYSENRYRECLSLFSGIFPQKPGFCATAVTLKACAGLRSLVFGKMVHGFIKKTDEIGRNLFVVSALVQLYAKCGEMDDALCVFDEYPRPDTVLWTCVITGYEQNHQPEQSLKFFGRMVAENSRPCDPITLVSLVSACGQMLNLRTGRSIHGYMIRSAFEYSLPLVNAVLHLYGKLGCINPAANLFKSMLKRDVISWGSIIACHAHHGFPGNAIDLFNQMLAGGIEPNAVSFVSAFQACEVTRNLEEGKRLHKFAAMKGFDTDLFVSTALVDMYMNCCSPSEAFEVFDSMPQKDAFCFSAMLSGCVRNGMPYESIQLFHDMVVSNLRPGAFDLVNALAACSELGFLQQTRCCHSFTVKHGFQSDPFTSASLVECYAKCGSLDEAFDIFSNTKSRDVVMWSAMLAAYGYHGKAEDALEMFNEMVNSSVSKPNEVSFLSLLSACSQAGLLNEGSQIFNRMLNEYELSPGSKHYGTVVDLLGRAGELEEALEFIISRVPPQPPAGSSDVWGALLGACWVHKESEMGEVAAKELMKLGSSRGGGGHRILMSNMYAADGKWVDAAEVRRRVAVGKKEVRRRGESVIEIRDVVRRFVANDTSHRDCGRLYQ
ncbi:hypothetical protein M569_01107, partial [Genlisea aurea]